MSGAIDPRSVRDLAGWVALLGFVIALVAPLGGLLGAELRVGELVEVAPESDPSQTYTLYLPPGYGAPATEGPAQHDPAQHDPAQHDPAPRYPALMILDPRGRGAEAAERFRPAAERYGWILVSSHHTASDGAFEPNLRAVNALMRDLALRWSVDPARVYAAGMSGTAVVAWTVAARTGGLAGVIAAAAPHQPGVFAEVKPTGLARFAHVATVGLEDFNFHEMRAMDGYLGELGAAHWLVYFDGAHGWMPPELATAAVGWLEVQAMRQGRRPVDPELVRERFAADLERAQDWESQGRLLEALWSYQALVASYRGLAPVKKDLAPLETKLEALSKDPSVIRGLDQVAQGAAREQALRSALSELGGQARQGGLPPGDELIARFQVHDLKAESEREGPVGACARRMLSTLGTYTGFNLYRELGGRGQWAAAVAVLEVAVAIRSETPDLWYNLACAHALAGHEEAALQALETATEKGFRDLDHLRTDPDLKAIRGLEGYRELVESLESAGSGSGPP